MENLKFMFPPDDFALLGVILALPLIGAIVNGVFGKRAGKEAVTLVALSAVGVSFLLSLAAFFMLSQVQQGEQAVKFTWTAWHWLDIGLRNDIDRTSLDVAFSIDALSGTMALIVTGIGFLIHLYSTKYMEEDEGYHRFFCYLNLFIFSMLVLILGDSLPILFVGWEGVGLCSYLLIGFWFTEQANAQAGKKAFITNRIGDFGLLVAMGLLVYYVGALDWDGMEAGRGRLLTSVKLWPIGAEAPPAIAWIAGVVGWFVSLFSEAAGQWTVEAITGPHYVTPATLVGLAVFLGCAGKSAQIPLYVWLPDAMAGPTPVSALIHAATMVTAGVYLMCRMSAVFVLSPAAMFTVAFLGALTALFAATIALAQNDIKKVLAYSTVSQLGYMFLGVGVGAFVAGFFHVLTHAFFKACLFLGAGSVIHAMHARIHDHDASQDMRNMGGLKKYMPITFATFAVSWAAIVGFPGTSGFFSKDEILLKAKTSFIAAPIEGNTLGRGASRIELFQWPEWGPTFLYVVGAITAVLTAFYMTRLFVGTFFGSFKGWRIKKGWAPAHDEHHHDEHHHAPNKSLDGPKPHESPWQMTAPLVILAVFAGIFGFVNAHLPGGFSTHALTDWLNPVFARANDKVALVEGAETFAGPGLIVALAAFAIGVGVAYWIYVAQRGEPAKRLVTAFPRLHTWAVEKWRIDEFYEETVIGAVDSLAEFATWFDRWVVDGILARFTSFVVAASGALLRLMQTGRVQAYAATMAVGMAAVGWFLVRPHAAVEQVADHASGQYTLVAASGLGYAYRWDLDGDGEWDSEEFGDQRKVGFTLDVEQKRTVRVQVKNTFGSTADREFEFERPKPDLSGASGMTRIDVTPTEDGRLQGVPAGHPKLEPKRLPPQLRKALNQAVEKP